MPHDCDSIEKRNHLEASAGDRIAELCSRFPDLAFKIDDPLETPPPDHWRQGGDMRADFVESIFAQTFQIADDLGLQNGC